MKFQVSICRVTLAKDEDGGVDAILDKQPCSGARTQEEAEQRVRDNGGANHEEVGDGWFLPVGAEPGTEVVAFVIEEEE